MEGRRESRENVATAVGDLNGDVLLKILGLVREARDLVRAMAVCRAWKEAASSVSFVHVDIPDSPMGYEGKLGAIFAQLASFHSLKRVHARIGKAKPLSEAIDDSNRKCLRYAEVGPSVEKFLFLAARVADGGVFSQCSLSAGVSSAGSSSTGRECSEAQMRAAASAESQRQQQADWSAASLPLNPVLGPTDHSLRLMMPVIVFAIIRGFDELLPVLPPLVFRIPSLENLLVVDLGDSVTLNVRPHHMHSLRKLWASRLMRSSRPLGVRPMLLAQHSVRASPSMPLVATGAGSVPGYALGGSGRIPMTNELVQDFVQPVHTDGPGTRDSSNQYLSVHTQHTLSQAVGVGPQEATQLTLPATAEAGGTAVAAAAQPSSQGPPAEIQMAAGSGELTEESVQLVTEPEQVAEEREQLEEEGEGTVAAAAPRPIPLGVQAAAQLVVGPVQRLRHELSLSSDLDISFWRADEASVCSWKVKDISVCIAANGSTPLSSEELSTLADTAFGGQLLAATMSRVNGKRGASFL